VRRAVGADGIDFTGPVNIGSEEMVTIKSAAEWSWKLRGRSWASAYPRPTGRSRAELDNKLIRAKLRWAPSRPLREGWKKRTPGFPSRWKQVHGMMMRPLPLFL